MDPKAWIDISGQVLVLAGLLFAISKFTKEKKREFQKGFFQEQLTIFGEVLDCVSNVSLYEKDTDEYKKAVDDFKRLYWGKMCLVEDQEVESGMVKFNRKLNQYTQSSDLVSDEEIKNDLQQFGLMLAHACRDSALRIWGTKEKLEGFNDYTWGKEKAKK